MKLLNLHIKKSDSCGGLLNGLRIHFRSEDENKNSFYPFCLIGPNGSGKSQVLQIIAEIFHNVYAYFLPHEEFGDISKDLIFELSYMSFVTTSNSEKVRLSSSIDSKGSYKILIEKEINHNWKKITDIVEVSSLLPRKIIGYTSGENETISWRCNKECM